MITTRDNPYNPDKDFDEWRAFDELHGYHTLSLIARLSITSMDFEWERIAEDTREAERKIVEILPELYVLVEPA